MFSRGYLCCTFINLSLTINVQGVLAKRRSNFHGNHFPVITEVARKDAAISFENRVINQNGRRFLVFFPFSIFCLTLLFFTIAQIMKLLLCLNFFQVNVVLI